MADVVQITDRTVVNRVNTDVVDILKDALTQALEGKVAGIAVVQVMADGGVETRYATHDEIYRLLSGLTLLHYRVTVAAHDKLAAP